LLPDFSNSAKNSTGTPETSASQQFPQQNVQVIIAPVIIVPPGTNAPEDDTPALAQQFAEAEAPSAPVEKKPETVDEILAAGGVSRTIYDQVRGRVIRDQLATVAHVENIIGGELVDHDGTPGIVNSPALAKTILKALACDGVIKQTQPGGKRIVLIPAGGNGDPLHHVPPRERPFYHLGPH
jgi:hypothetical protein